MKVVGIDISAKGATFSEPLEIESARVVQDAPSQTLTELEALRAEGERLLESWRNATADFWGLFGRLAKQEERRRKRSRHPRLHSKGRRSRWPRGVDA